MITTRSVTRHVWNEIDDDEEAELFRDDLNARLDELEGTDDFLDIPIDDLIASLCRDLGFEPPEPPAAPATSPIAAARAGAVEGAGQAPGGPAVHAPNTS